MRGLATLILGLGLAACDSAVELELVPNKYLLLPFATTELADGKLSLGANGLWPLASGRRYHCWATDSQGARPARRLGAIQDGWLVVREASLGIKLTDYDGLRCTIESTAEPASPSEVVALQGAPGKVLMFASEGLLAEVKAARAHFRIEGLLADYRWERLPALPPGFFYGLYLRGVLPDPNAALGVSSTHQHLLGEERARADTTGSATAPTERLVRVTRLTGGAGQGRFAERSGLNLTGLRKAICAIEADDGDGLPAIAALAAPADSVSVGATAPSSPPPDPPPSSDGGTADGAAGLGKLDAKLEWNPSHPHTGEVITFTFRVTENGAPATGLSASASYQHLSGATGTIALSADSTPGVYVGTKALFASGLYAVKLSVDRGGTSFTKSFDLTIEDHP